ncbi:MAG: hypothetical protein ACT4P4_13740 [Betaproteobacteria bacterium]
MQQKLDFLGRVAEATDPARILEIVKSYLGSWPRERIEALQKLDGGWGPFDAGLKPVQVTSATHLRCMRDAVHAQCMALREAHMTPSAELAELEAFFFVAQYRLELLGAEAPRPALELTA